MYVILLKYDEKYIINKYDNNILEKNKIENKNLCKDKIMKSYDYEYKLIKNLNNFNIFSSKILFIVSLPEGMNFEEFLKIINDYEKDIEFLRCLKNNKILEKNEVNFFQPIVIYFNNELAADNFLNNFDCNKIIDEFDPLYILKIKEIYFVDDLNINDYDFFIDFVEFPKCPKCLEKIETEYTEILIPETYEKISWVNSKFYCNVCLNITNKNFNNCEECDDCENIWICLICGKSLCGRFKNKHSLKHFYNSSHNFVINNDDMIWCYQLDKYIHKYFKKIKK